MLSTLLGTAKRVETRFLVVFVCFLFFLNNTTYIVLTLWFTLVWSET